MECPRSPVELKVGCIEEEVGLRVGGFRELPEATEVTGHQDHCRAKEVEVLLANGEVVCPDPFLHLHGEGDSGGVMKRTGEGGEGTQGGGVSPEDRRA